MRYLILLFTLMVSAVVAFAQEVVPPETLPDLQKYLPGFIEALLAGDYKYAAGVFVMILAVVGKQFFLPKWNLTPRKLQYAIAIFSGLGFAGLSLLSPAVGWAEGFINGVTAALVAGGMWDLGLQDLLEWMLKLVGITPAKPVPPPPKIG